MSSLCLTLQLHLPNRLRHYSFFDIGESSSYEDQAATLGQLEQASAACILPANQVLLRRLQEYRGDFKIALSLSGLLLEELERFSPGVLDSFKALADTGHVEFLAEPYYHSLSSVFSMQEFREQVTQHQAKIKSLFGQTCTTLRNTGLIHSDEIAREAEQMGFLASFSGGGVRLTGKRNPNHLFRPATCQALKVLVQNDTLSEDIMLRFTNRDWPEYPLSPATYEHWIKQGPARGEILNLTLDLARFTGPNPVGTGLCDFLAQFPDTVLLHKGSRFQNPTEVARFSTKTLPLATPTPLSGVPPDYDLTPWLGNEMQKDSLHALYLLEAQIKGHNNPAWLRIWRILQNADHFLYMSTRPDATGEANPYGSPYDTYINFMNILTDFTEHIEG